MKHTIIQYKDMKKQAFKLLNLLFASTFVAMTSCTDGMIEGVKTGMGIDTSDDYVTNINLEVEDFEYVKDNATRTQLVHSTNGGVQFKWFWGDKIGVVPVKDNYDTYQNLEFTVDMKNTDGRNAKFDNGGFMLKKDMNYAAYYPYSYETQNPNFNINRIPVSYRGQHQDYNNSINHLSKFDYMAAAPVKSNDGSLTFNFQHFGTICHFALTLPDLEDYRSLKAMYITFMNKYNNIVNIPVVGEICDISIPGELTLHYDTESKDIMDNSLKIELSPLMPDLSKKVDLFVMMPFYLFNGNITGDPTKMQITVVDADNFCHTCYIAMPARRDYSGKVLYFEENVPSTKQQTRTGLHGKTFNDAIKEYVDPVAIKKVVISNDVDFDYQGEYDIDLSNSNDVFKVKANLNRGVLTVSTDAAKIGLSDGFSMFEDFSGMTEIEGLPILDTSNMSSTASMFKNCSSLETLDLKTFDNKDVHIFDEMFSGCSNLRTLSWSKNFIQTSNDVRLERMFSGCKCLQSIDLRIFEGPIHAIAGMNHMFDDCLTLRKIDLSKFNTSRVTNMSCMFRNCFFLEDIVVGESFSTESVTDMSYMFAQCYSFDYDYFGDGRLDMREWNTSKVTDMSYMFSYCNSIEYLDLTNFDTRNVVSMESMFEGCTFLKGIYMHNINTQSLTNCSFMFYKCVILDQVDLYAGTFSNVTNAVRMFAETWNVLNINLSNMTLNANILSMPYSDIELKYSSMFYKCGSSHSLSNNGTKTLMLINKKMEGILSKYRNLLDLYYINITYIQ